MLLAMLTTLNSVESNDISPGMQTSWFVFCSSPAFSIFCSISIPLQLTAFAKIYIRITGITTLGSGRGVGGVKSTIGVRSFNLRRSQVRNRGNVGLNQSRIHKHAFSPTQPFRKYFYSIHLPLFDSVTPPKKEYSYIKNIGNSFASIASRQ